MAGGIEPPQDSERRALVGTSQKNPLRTKPWKEPQGFVRHLIVCAPGAASRVCDELASLALDPAPGAEGVVFSKTHLTKPTTL
jgi:hypothetical protein